jgi:hypothetical protein
MFALLLSVVPGFLLNAWKVWATKKADLALESERTKRETTLAQVNAMIDLRRQQADVIKTGMSHRLFWIPWLVAAVPATVWYAWGMLDSSWVGHLPHVSELPPQLKFYTDQVFSNLFLPGSIALGGTAIAGAIGSALKRKL